MKTVERQDERGFTIAEVVTAMFLLTVGLMGLASVLVTTAKRQTYSEAMTTMTNLAVTTLEQVRSTPYEQIASFTEDYGRIQDYPRYRRQVVVTPNADDTIRVVEVRVTATTGQQVSIETAAAR
jgi:Tfp pilus assembly protein PilV